MRTLAILAFGFLAACTSNPDANDPANNLDAPVLGETNGDGGACTPSCSDKACGAPDGCNGTCCTGSGCTPITCAGCQTPDSCGSACVPAPAGWAGTPTRAPYVCNGSSTTCPTSCTSDNDCVCNGACVGNVCTNPKPPTYAQLVVPPFIQNNGHKNDPLILAGYLDATLYGADPSGNPSSAGTTTQAIQNAMNDARDYGLTTYLPAGTYFISNTLNGRQYLTSACLPFFNQGTVAGNSPQAPSLVGPATGPRPLVKLVDSSAGFGDATQPKPMLHMYNDGMIDGVLHPSYARSPAKVGAFDCFFYGVVRDIDFAVGTGNTGAIGVQFYSAQYSYLQNVSVTATGGYAGFEGGPGTNVWTNLAVTGGQYGLMFDGECGTITVAGVTLKGQTTAGLYNVGNCGATVLAGFDIETVAAPAITLGNAWAPQTTSLSLYDGYLQVTGGAQPAVENPTGLNLYLNNVYAKASSVIVENAGATALSATGAVDLIKQYSHTETATGAAGETTAFRSVNVVNGVTSQQDIVSTQANAGAPPTDLVLRHTPGTLPWLSDSGRIDVTAFGADPTGSTDSTCAIQRAIINSDVVFLPRGDYAISETIQLNPNTRLFGVPGSRSRIMAPRWDPGGQFKPFLRTANSTTGKTYVGDVYLQLDGAGESYGQTYLSALEWQTGRSSVQNQVAATLAYQARPNVPSAARSLIHVVNNGGGRWFGTQLMLPSHGYQQASHSAFREIFVDHTQTPLTIYGSNPEHGQGDYLYTIAGASNVRLLGVKSEADGLLEVRDSTNVSLVGLNGNHYPRVTFSGDDNLCMANYGWYAAQPNNANITNITHDGKTYSFNDAYSLFAMGTCSTAPSFPHCGDTVCDGAETHANCPADCRY